MYYKLSVTGEIVYPSKRVPGLVLSQIYIFQDCMGIIKQFKYSVAGVTRFHFHFPGFASGNRLALEELESYCTLNP